MLRIYRATRAWFDELSIRSKGLVLIAIPCLYMVLLLASFSTFFSEYRDAERSAAQSENLLIELTNFEAKLFQTILLTQGIGTTEVPNQNIEISWAQLEDSFHRLVDMSAGRPERIRRLHKIRSIGESLLMQPTNRVGQEYPGVMSDNATSLASLQDLLTTILTSEFRRNGEQRSRVLKTGQFASKLAVASFISALLIAGFVWHLFSTSVSSRIRRMRENLTRMERGEELRPQGSAADEIGALDKALFEITRALRTKNHENQLFVYSVSHDLRSPLVNLQGFSKELEFSLNEMRALGGDFAALGPGGPRLHEILNSDIPHTLSFIRTAVQRISSIIDALLKVSRAGKQETKLETVALQELIARIVDSNRALLHEREAHVRVYSLPQIVSDTTALEQIFGNLISNAIKYLKPGPGGDIEIGVAPSTSGEKGYTFFVRDNGVGIPKPYHSKIFVAFQRLHPDIAAGEGIGLVLVQRAVEKLGGKIWFESTADAGTVFYIYLPGKADLAFPVSEHDRGNDNALPS